MLLRPKKNMIKRWQPIEQQHGYLKGLLIPLMGVIDFDDSFNQVSRAIFMHGNGVPKNRELESGCSVL